MTTTTTTTARQLPLEFNPDSWAPSGQTARCLQQVPIRDAYTKLSACYSAGGDLQTCDTQSAYTDTHRKYQLCLAGTDQTQAQTPNTPATASTPQTVIPTNTLTYVLIALQGTGVIITIFVLLMLIRRKA